MYVSTTNLAALVITLGLGLGFGSVDAGAATATSSIAVSATVVATCAVGRPSGHANGAPPEVRCSHAVPFSVETSARDHAAVGNPSISRSAGSDAAGPLTTVTY